MSNSHSEEGIFDVCVVGSGAAGGTISSRLARKGLNVIVVEGGPKVDTTRAFNTHAMPYEFRDRKVPVMVPGFEGFEDPRAHGVGGKTLLWNAVALRFSHRNFKNHSYEGAGVDWPIDYPDMAPYYDQMEREIGVCGNLDHLEDLPDGIFLPPLPLRCSDRIIQRGAARLGINFIHTRKATLTRPQQARPACHYCGNCMAGCDVVAKYNSASVQIMPALSSGKLTLLQDAVVSEVTVNSENKVDGVKYLNRHTLQEGRVRARLVVVSCACVQSVALLLMSRSRAYPTGLANSSGNLGKHFIPHIHGNLLGFVRDLIGTKPLNEEGALDHGYIPSYMHNRKRDFAGSFHIQLSFHNRRLVPWAKDLDGFGGSLKKRIRDYYPAFVHIFSLAEMFPNEDSRIELDPTEKDRYGLPKVKTYVKYGENDLKLFVTLRNEARRIAEASNVEILTDWPEPGRNHALGGCRMGKDARTSVVNSFCQAHDIPNLFVVTGASFLPALRRIRL